MDRFKSHRDVVANVAAVVLPVGVAAILVPFRASFADTAAALVLVAAVVSVAVLGGRVAGILAAFSSTLSFDFFLTRPYERLAITHRPDIETAVSLFVVGIVVTELAARSRHHYEAAAEESDHVGRIHVLSELAASGAPASEVIERVRTELIELLGLRSCRYEPGSPERPRIRIEPDGHVVLAGTVWGVHRVGLPGPELELPVQSRGQTLGRYVLKPTPGSPVSLQRRVVAVAIADQVGAALVPRLRSA
jgi:K+-sensing histidine kinase KdpD